MNKIFCVNVWPFHYIWRHVKKNNSYFIICKIILVNIFSRRRAFFFTPFLVFSIFFSKKCANFLESIYWQIMCLHPPNVHIYTQDCILNLHITFFLHHKLTLALPLNISKSGYIFAHHGCGGKVHLWCKWRLYFGSERNSGYIFAH